MSGNNSWHKGIRMGRCRHGFTLGLRILALSTFGAMRGLAQTPAVAPSVAARLDVHLRELKGADQTKRAGEFALDSLPGYRLYVPPACVGQRCPLLVVVSDFQTRNVPGWHRPMADRYGLIVLTVDYYFARPLVSYDSPNSDWYKDLPPATPRLAAALQQVLRRVAVDPDKIALHGLVAAPSTCNAWYWAMQNLDVFSRVVLNVLGEPPLADAPLPKRTSVPAPLFLLTAHNSDAAGQFRLARELRQRGYSTQMIFSMMNYYPLRLWEEYDFIGRWLRDSWAQPKAATRPAAAHTPADSLPLLTKDAIAKLAAFWASFQQEPDSIRRLGRRQYLRELRVPVGSDAEQPVTVLTNMAGLAARYPSVAAKLRAAGLTAQQHDAIRLALLSAKFATALEDSAMVGPANSVLAQNVALLESDDPVFHADGLDETAAPWKAGQHNGRWMLPGMWQTP